VHSILRAGVKIDVSLNCFLLCLISVKFAASVQELASKLHREGNAKLNHRENSSSGHSDNEGRANIVVPLEVEVVVHSLEGEEAEAGIFGVGVGENKKNSGVEELNDEDGGHDGRILAAFSVVANPSN